MRNLTSGVWAAIAVFIVSVIFLFQSFDLPYSNRSGPGPGFFPVWLGGIMLVLSLFYMYESIRNRKNPEGEPLPRGEALKEVLIILGCLIAFVFLLPYLGFLLSGALFLFALLYRSYKWYVGAGISVVVSLLLFWLFDTLLGVPLPVDGLGW